MDRILKQHVFTSIEQEYFVQIMEETAQKLYGSETMTAEQYAGLAARLMETGDYGKAAVWCDRALEQYPGELVSYQCKLKLLFLTEEREAFFELLERLKSSNIPIDSGTLETIRIFQ
jgi:hypothetical protein